MMSKYSIPNSRMKNITMCGGNKGNTIKGK